MLASSDKCCVVGDCSRVFSRGLWGPRPQLPWGTVGDYEAGECQNYSWLWSQALCLAAASSQERRTWRVHLRAFLQPAHFLSAHWGKAFRWTLHLQCALILRASQTCSSSWSDPIPPGLGWLRDASGQELNFRQYHLQCGFQVTSKDPVAEYSVHRFNNISIGLKHV